MNPDKIVESPTHPYKDKPIQGKLPHDEKKSEQLNS